MSDKLYVTFSCPECGTNGRRYAVERGLVRRIGVSSTTEMPCPMCDGTAIVTETMTVPPRDDDVQAVLEAWPEVRRLILKLVGPSADLFASVDTIAQLRRLVESLPEDV